MAKTLSAMNEEPTCELIIRSKLFVPASRPELFAKALTTDADAVSIDLEDSVVDRRKDEARAHVVDFLESPDARASRKTIIVRCNAIGTRHFDADIAAIARSGLDVVNAPKIESTADIRALAEAMDRAEANNRVVAPAAILATIESPAGLRHATEIATAHLRVGGLQLGLNDLFGSLNGDRSNTANVHAGMFALRMAAGEAGVCALDGAYTDIGNEQGFRLEADMARQLGFVGKSCIHPSQVALANEIFMPSDEEIAAAIQVLEASRQAESEGCGAFTVDGNMIDLPSIRRAEALLAMQKRWRDR